MSALTGDRPIYGARWWVFLITAAAWLIVAWVVLRFDMRTVNAIAVLAGVIILLAAAAELFNMLVTSGWRWLHGLLGVLFLITGVVALVDPGRTFVWLSAFIGWYLLFKGTADIVLAFVTKAYNEAWWLGLLVGIIEVMFGFWAAGNFHRSAYLLVVYVAVIALTRAVTDIVTAFGMRALHERSTAGPTTVGPTTAAPA